MLQSNRIFLHTGALKAKMAKSKSKTLLHQVVLTDHRGVQGTHLNDSVRGVFFFQNSKTLTSDNDHI